MNARERIVVDALALHFDDRDGAGVQDTPESAHQGLEENDDARDLKAAGGRARTPADQHECQQNRFGERRP